MAARLAHRWSAAARRHYDIDRAEALDVAVRRIYRRRGALLQSAGWRPGGWFAGAGETWLVFHAMGQPIGLINAIIIESLGHAARTAAFIVPGVWAYRMARFCCWARPSVSVPKPVWCWP